MYQCRRYAGLSLHYPYTTAPPPVQVSYQVIYEIYENQFFDANIELLA